MAWQAGLWPAGRLLHTSVLGHFGSGYLALDINCKMEFFDSSFYLETTL